MPTSRLALFIASIIAALALTLLLIFVIMQPPLADLSSLALMLGFTSAGSAALGFLSQRMGWWRRLRRITLALTLGYLLAAGLTIFNVWVTAKLMFIIQHDLALGALLLLFATGISVAFGYFITSSMTDTLRELLHGAERLSEGDFAARVPVAGRDEVAQVAQAFNEMAARLEQAAETERQLEEARRHLIAGASHDLRTPLTSVRAMLDALAEGVVSDPATIARYLHKSQGEINRMSALIDSLFDLALLDTGHLELERERGSLADLISDTLESFTARAHAAGVALTGSAVPEVDPVWMDIAQISRVLNNLLDNALRHTPEGGRVRVRAAREEDMARVRVADSGPGISPEDLPHIFEHFYRGEKSRSREGFAHGGTGRGLAIAKGIVEAHGGRIWAESAPEEGTQVIFTLPVRP